MNFWNKFRLAKLFFQLVKDPSKTNLIIEGVHILSQNREQEPLQAIEQRVLSIFEFSTMYKDHYFPDTPALSMLSLLPAESFGYAVYKHMEKNGINFDIFPRSHSGSIVEYLSARIYQDHDLWHVLLNKSVDIEDELALQAFAVAQLQSPIAVAIISGGLLHLLTKNPQRAVDAFKGIVESYLIGRTTPFLLSIRLHELFELPLHQVRQICGLPNSGVASQGLRLS